MKEDEKRELFERMKEKEQASLQKLVDMIFGEGALDIEDAYSIDYPEAMEHLTDAAAHNLAIGHLNAKLINIGKGAKS